MKYSFSLLLLVCCVFGCTRAVNPWNPDGSLNTRRQVKYIEYSLGRLSSALYEREYNIVYKYMMNIVNLVDLLPERPADTKWSTAREEIHHNMEGVKASLRIGDVFAAQDFLRRVSLGVSTLSHLAPILYDADATSPLPSDEDGDQDATPSPPGPTRPPGLYDD